MAELGSRSPRPAGAARLGLRRSSVAQRVARLAGVPLDRLAAAFDSARGDGVLDVVAEGAALHLVTPEIIRLAEERTGWPASPYGDGRSVQLGGNGSTGPQWVIREDDGVVSLLRAAERSNEFTTELRSRSLAEVQARLLTDLGADLTPAPGDPPRG